MSERAQAPARAAKAATKAHAHAGGLVQRKCACGGNASGLTGNCGPCAEKKRRGIQTKLRVGPASDHFEQEADRVTDEVMRGHTRGPNLFDAAGTQRRAVTPVGPSPAGETDAPPAVQRALDSSGQPLDPGTRAFMESRFGHDFGRVRVHADERADTSARAVDALAYTVGDNVFFAAGQYAPHTHEGRRLLAHELTHVLQQGGGAASPVQRQSAGLLLQRDAAAPSRKLVVLSPAEIKADREREQRRINTGQDEAKVCKSYGQGGDDKNCPAKLRPGAEVTYVAEPIRGAWYQIENTGFEGFTDMQQKAFVMAAFFKEKAAAGAAATPKAAPAANTSDAELLKKGDFVTVLNSLNGMAMKEMLKRVQKLQSAQLQLLNYHVFDSKGLGEKAGWRMASALGAAHMSREGADAVKVNALEDAMRKAELPSDQRELVRAIVPPIRGGAAARVDAHFDLPKQLGQGSAAAPLVEKWSTAEAFNTLNGMSDKDLRDALQRIDKGQLQALMKSTRSAEKYGELPVERLRQALYVAWVTRFPEEAPKFDVGEEDSSWVAKMSVGAKITEAMRRSITRLPGQGGERLRELLTPEAIAMMAGFAVVYIVSQTTPVGWLADLLVAGLIAATIIMLGRELIEIVQLVIRFADKAAGAKVSTDLDEAAELFATAVTKVGIDIILAIIFHKAGRAANLKPPTPRSPGIIDVFEQGGARGLQQAAVEAFQKGGGKITSKLFPDQPLAAELVTANGAKPVPLNNVPGLKLMMEAKGVGGEPPAAGAGGRPAGGRGVAAEGVEPAAKPAPKPRGQGVSAGAGVKKPKLKAPGADPAVVEEPGGGGKRAAAEKRAADKPGAAEKPAEGETSAAEKPKAEGPTRAERAAVRAQAKDHAYNKLKDAQETKTQILNEIIENREQAKGKPPAERAKLDAEWQNLKNQLNNAQKIEAEWQAKYTDFDLTPYERARAYSMSDAAWTEAMKRAKGLDEISGKKPDSVSVDHTVSVKEMSDMKGFDDLHPDDMRKLVSTPENLKTIDSDLNSSKGNKRWADWETGRRHYGEEAWKKMVEFENGMRAKLQSAIESFLKVRRKQ